MTPLVVIGVLLFCAFGLPPALLLLFGWLAAPHRTNGYLGEPRRLPPPDDTGVHPHHRVDFGGRSTVP